MALACVPLQASAATTPGWKIGGQLGGEPRAIAISGRYAYAGVGAHVIVIDVSDRANPRQAGSSPLLPHTVQDIALSGQYAYAATGPGGLRILDLTDAAHPIEVGSWSSPGFARGVAIAGTVAYVADGQFGLRLLDVSNPAKPREMASAFPLHNAYKVRVDGRYAYLAGAGAGLLVADISDPVKPVELATLKVPGYAYDLAVGGGFAYVAAGWGGLQVVSLADPARLSLAGSLALPGWAFGVALVPGRAYVADATHGLRIVDISSPRQPAELGGIEWSFGVATAVAIGGDTAFLADSQFGLHVIDVSNSTQPVRTGFFPVLAHGDFVAIQGGLAYVAAGYAGLHVADISDPANPRQLGAWVDGLSYFTGVWVYRNLVYVTSIAGDGWGLHIFDVSDPSRPRRIARFTPSVGQMHDVVVSGNIAYLAGEHELMTVDVSDPSRPVAIDTLPLSTEFGTFDARVVVAGNRAYMLLHGLVILDLSNPRRPVLAGTYNPGSGFSGLAVRGNTVFLAGGGNVSVVDVSDPAKPVPIGSAKGPGFPIGVAVLGSHLFVASANAGLNVYDISDPRSVALVSSTRSPGNARELVVTPGTVYIADESGGLTVLQQGPDQVAPPARSQWADLSPSVSGPEPLRRAVAQPRNGAVCVVTSSADSGNGTLRACLNQALYGDTVTFDAATFPPSTPAAIVLQSPLPFLRRGALTIDASDSGVILDGSHTPPGSSGIMIESPDNIVRGLQIVGFSGFAISVWAPRNHLGGERKRGRGPSGEGNLLSGNGTGIGLDVGATDCVITGNFIGTTLDGRSPWPNRTGMFLAGAASNNVIRNNVISGNTGRGISMTDWYTGFVSFTGNFIGTDAAGAAALGNGTGMALAYLGYNRVGGTDPGDRNVISGNLGLAMYIGFGIGNLVLGNYIGVDVSGSVLLANRDGGIQTSYGARQTTIGGATDAERNIIAGVMSTAAIASYSDFTFITGNSIGADAAGAALGGSGDAITLNGAEHNIVQRNSIAYNHSGVTVGSVGGGAYNTIRQNAIWQNQGNGISIRAGARALSAPLVAQASRSSVSGRTCAGCTVEVFSDAATEGRNFEGQTVGDASGAFAFTKTAGFIAANVTLTATDQAGNTSAFSSCVQRVSVSTISVPAAGASGRFTVSAPAGCPWQANASDNWIKAGGAFNGSADVGYTVSANPSPAVRVGSITAGGQVIPVQQDASAGGLPLPQIGAVLSAANAEAGVSPGAWLSVYGRNMAPLTRAWAVTDFVGDTLPSQLEGVAVYVNGRPGAIAFLSPQQINVLAPDDTAAGPVSVYVVTPVGASEPFSVNLSPAAPGFFTFAGSSSVAAVFPNGEYAAAPAALPGLSAHPAQPGDVLSLFGTGFGPAEPPVPSAYLLRTPAPLAALPIVRIGNVAAEVRYAGIVASGLDQINIVVPALPGGDHLVTAEVNGRKTTQQALLTVRVP